MLGIQFILAVWLIFGELVILVNVDIILIEFGFIGHFGYICHFGHI